MLTGTIPYIFINLVNDEGLIHMHPIIKQYNNWGIIMCMDVSHAKRQWQGFKTSFYYFYLFKLMVSDIGSFYLSSCFYFFIIVLTIWIGQFTLTYNSCISV